MKRPTRLQIFFAQNWPIRAWLTLGPLAALVAAVRVCQPSMAMLADWQAVLLLIAVIALAPVCGYFSALVIGGFVFGPMYYLRGLINGAPFKERDVVQVLVGPHRGKITTVYATWQGDSVRVRLGAKEAETFKDVFGTTDLLRDTETEPAAPPYSEPAARSHER